MSFLDKLLGRESEQGSGAQTVETPELSTPEAIEKSFTDLADEAADLPPEVQAWAGRLLNTVGAAHSLEISKAVAGDETEELGDDDDEAAALSAATESSEVGDDESLEGVAPDGAPADVDSTDGQVDGDKPVKVQKSLETPAVEDATPILREIAQALHNLAPLVGQMGALQKSVSGLQQEFGTIQKSLGENQVITKSIHEFVENRSPAPAGTPTGAVRPGAGVRPLDINKSMEPVHASASQNTPGARFGMSDEDLSRGMFAAISKGMSGLTSTDLGQLPGTAPEDRPKSWYEAAAKELGYELAEE